MIKSGDVVKLRSGGPSMTVGIKGNEKSPKYIQVSYFDKEQILREAYFLDDQLKIEIKSKDISDEQ